jgi:hypothetical protein
MKQAVCKQRLAASMEQLRHPSRTDIDQACGVVSNVCCDVSALTGAMFKASPAPLPPAKPAIACTSWAVET